MSFITMHVLCWSDISTLHAIVVVAQDRYCTPRYVHSNGQQRIVSIASRAMRHCHAIQFLIRVYTRAVTALRDREVEPFQIIPRCCIGINKEMKVKWGDVFHGDNNLSKGAKQGRAGFYPKVVIATPPPIPRPRDHRGPNNLNKYQQ